MKKIIFSFLAIALAVGSTAGAAYALFSDTINVSGITITAGSASLLASDHDGGYTHGPFSLGIGFTGLYPGEITVPKTFWLENNSANVALDVTGQLVSATGDWGVLSPVVYLKIDNASNPSLTTGWQTLASWNSGAIAFPSNPLGISGTQEYQASFYVDSGAGNGISGKTLDITDFDVVGTQH